MEKLLIMGSQPVRLLLGYAGWDRQQLEDEMKQGAWLTAPLEACYIFDVHLESLWKRLLSEMGVDPLRLIPGEGVH